MGRAEAAERDLGFPLPATGSPRKVDKPVSWVLFPSVGLVCEHRRGGSHGGEGGGAGSGIPGQEAVGQGERGGR